MTSIEYFGLSLQKKNVIRRQFAYYTQVMDKV